ncbi:MAG: hypothetical protein R3F61_08875 [Myxococcota bacterium]
MRFAIVAVLAAACAPEIPEPIDLDAFEARLDPGTARMAGEMPIVGAFDRDVNRNEAALWTDAVEFHVDATEGDWVMLGGEVTLPVAAIPEGEWVEVDDRDHWIYGCSGPRDRAIRYDGSAESVWVHREPVDIGPGAQRTPERLMLVASFGRAGVVGVVVEPSVGEPD